MIIIRDNAVEVITIKFNLKSFVFLLELNLDVGNIEEANKQKDEFSKFIVKQSDEMKKKIFDYLFKQRAVQGNENIKNFLISKMND